MLDAMRAPSIPLNATTLVLCAALALPGCNLFASAVPCQVDDNCALGERCRAGTCVAGGVTLLDGGARADAGEPPGGDDAGPLDGGEPPAPTCAPRLVVTAGSVPVPAAHPLKVSLDHAALVALGFAPDGSDLHLFYDDGTAESARARVLSPLSAWNTDASELWFALAAPLAAGESTSAYVLRSRADAPPDDNEASVFPLADFFERPDADVVEPPWSAPYAGIGVRAGGLEVLGGDNLYNRPLLDLTLPPLTTRFELVTGFHFLRSGDESEYRVHLHLGDSSGMIEPPSTPEHFARDGAAVSLVWAGVGATLSGEEVLAADGPGGYAELGVVSGEHALSVRVDPASDRYDIFVDGAERLSTLPFLNASDVIDRFRMVIWRVGTSISARRLEYLYVRPLLAAEPSVSVELPADCP